MRRLLWFTIGFAATCLVSVCFLWNAALRIFSAVCLVVAAVVFFKGKGKMRQTVLILLGCGAAFLWVFEFRGLYLNPICKLDGQRLTLTMTAVESSETALYGERVLCRMTWKNKSYKTLVYLRKDQKLEAGDTLTAEYTVRRTTPGGKKESLYYSASGYFLVATQKTDGTVDTSGRGDLSLLPVKVADSLKKVIASCVSGDEGAFAKALLLGDTDDLSYETNLSLKISGIRHAVAVSGLHVGILYSMIRFLTMRKRFLTALLGIPILAFFAAMAGFSPSVSRACVMTGLAILAELLQKQYDAPTALAFGALLLLLKNPFCAASVSLQLSVASVAGILMFYPRWNRWLQKELEKLSKWKTIENTVRWIGSSAGVSLCAMIFTTPLSAYYFGTVSIISVVTNLLTLWCITLIFCGTGILSIVGEIYLPAGQLIGRILRWPIRYVLTVAATLSKVPFAAVYTRSVWIVGWLILCGILITLYFLRGKFLKSKILVCVLSFFAAIFLSWWIPRQDDFRVSVLDVGQGQCILLQSKGETCLIDCGGSSGGTAAGAAAAELLSQNVRHIDYSVMTHLDSDHTNGLIYLSEQIDIGCIFLHAQEAENSDNIPQNVQVVQVNAASQFNLGSGVVTMFPPREDSTENDNCICVLFTSENCGILITGDRSAVGEKNLVTHWSIPQTDILIAGHHGSKKSTSQFLLDTIQPEIVIISVGKNNYYGHPADEVLERLKQMNCVIYRTDTDGTVVIRR